MISMKEIGKICGVTESTVSKALRGHAGIKQATRERVAEVARKYGYQPNAMVECMQTGRSRSIGIACNNFQCMFTGAVMDGIHKTLHDYGYDSYVICWDKLVKDKIDLLSRFARRRVDGLLLLPMEHLPEAVHVAALRAFHNPVVLIDQVWNGAEFDYVGSDNRGGMATLVERLIAAGHRKIGSVFFSEVSSGEERKAGFLDAMFRHNLPVDARFLFEVHDPKTVTKKFAAPLINPSARMLSSVSTTISQMTRSMRHTISASGFPTNSPSPDSGICPSVKNCDRC